MPATNFPANKLNHFVDQKLSTKKPPKKCQAAKRRSVFRLQWRACSILKILCFILLDIRVSEEPKVITLKKKTILSYTYDFTTPNFLVFQAHTQYRNLSLSTLDGTESNTNSDTAILTLGSITNLNEGFHRLEYVLCPPNSTSVQALVTVVLSSQKGECGKNLV